MRPSIGKTSYLYKEALYATVRLRVDILAMTGWRAMTLEEVVNLVTRYEAAARDIEAYSD